ncbi:MAG: prepilin-type N-terminal cleavage/methylation domain-containing protein [Acidobacteriota bacterium]|jgi:prepilin-type N-terminal cleavage/methylation domain-containing protein
MSTSLRPSPGPNPNPDRDDTTAGFSLIEVLAALAILGLALLLGIGLLAQERDVLARLEAKQEANRAVEAVLEALRSGAVELHEGVREVPAVAPVGGAGMAGSGAAKDLTVVVRAWRAEPPADLFRAEVEARYTVLGEPWSLSVETLFWKPGKLKSH